jgi:hypothetical protein
MEISDQEGQPFALDRNMEGHGGGWRPLTQNCTAAMMMFEQSFVLQHVAPTSLAWGVFYSLTQCPRHCLALHFPLDLFPVVLARGVDHPCVRGYIQLELLSINWISVPYSFMI